VRKESALLLLLLILVCLPKISKGQASSPGAIALVGGTVIDGTGAPPVENAVVVLQNGRITAIGARKQMRVPSGAKQIDLHGKFVLPGLIDGHVHLVASSGPKNEGLHPPAFGEELIERIAANAKAHLMSGVTTVFDVGGSLHELKQIRDEINSKKRIGARIYLAGPIISSDRREPRSVPSSAVEALHLKRLVRGEFAGVDAARSKVRELARLGVDHIKVYQTGGRDHGYAGYATRVPPEEMVAIVEEARKAGIPVTAHTRGLEGFRNGIRAGLNSMQHVVYCGIRIPDEYIKMLAESPVYVIPTIVALSAPLKFIENPHLLGEDAKALALPKDAVSDLFKLITDPREYTRAHLYQMGVPQVPLGIENLKRLVQAKARIAMGTDAGTTVNFHGTSYREVVAMTEAGLTPMQAIVASTRNTALAFEKKDLGTLEVGKVADIIVVENNPLSDISNLRNVVHVFKAGEQYK
jgi:imidazolonepropionase-like amidohydrolase